MNPYPVLVLNSIAANGADATITEGNLFIAGLSTSIPVKGIMNLETTITPYVAEVLQISTGTPTAANNTTYTIEILSFNIPQQQFNIKTYNYLSDGTATATEICDGLRAAINADPSVNVVATGTTTLVLTAVAGQPIFTVSNVGDGTIIFAPTTAGVSGVGLGSQIAANNPYIPNGTGIVTTNHYTTVFIQYRAIWPYGDVTPSIGYTAAVVIYVNEGDADFASLIGTYGTLTNALNAYQLSYVAPVGTSPTLAYTTATGALALAGTGNTWASNAIKQGDVLFFNAAPTVFYPVLVQSTNTAGFSTAGIGGDIAASAFTIIHITPIVA